MSLKDPEYENYGTLKIPKSASRKKYGILKTIGNREFTKN
jgi:hypothetical protein